MLLPSEDIKHSIIKNLKSFENFSRDEVYEQRKTKFLQIGRGQGFSKSSNVNDASLSYKQSISKNKISYNQK